MKSFVESSASADKKPAVTLFSKNIHETIFAHHELYQRVERLEGSIVMCGIVSEEAFVAFAVLRSMMAPKKLVAFEKHTKMLYYDNTVSPFGSLNYQTALVNLDVQLIELNLLQKEITVENEFVPDYVTDAIPQYLIENPELKIAFLTINLDDYEATLTALEFFYPRLVQEGIIVIDNFGKSEEDRRAVNDYFYYDKVEINSFFEDKGAYFLVRK